MSIAEIKEKVKPKIKPFYTLILIIIVAGIFFVLGRISALEEQKTSIKITYPNIDQTGAIINSVSTKADEIPAQVSSQTTATQYIGNKNSKKYYFPWCSAVKASKPENLVTFSSLEEARVAGYVPGGNCKGLK